MKILFFSQYFWPENFRINDLALALDEAGHKITVLTGLPNYPEGEIYKTQNQLLKPVLAKIDDAIQKVGGDRGYDFILDAMSGALLYALDSHNLTEDVMDELAKATGSVTE